MADKQKDYYKMLGVARDAGHKEIKSAYRRLAKKNNPEFSENKRTKEDRLREIQEAYETLKDSERRQKYDADLTLAEAGTERTMMDVSNVESGLFDSETFDLFGELLENITFPSIRLDEELEIVLTSSQSQNGGYISIDLPAYFGVGFGFSSNSRRRFNLRIPTGVQNGDIKNLYIPEIDFWVRIRFRVFE